MRLIARQTWRYFETFVTADEHMLPPDNFQEVPAPVTAHRTSPTNIGLYLMSVTSARDLGWIGTLEAAERIEATLATMAEMTRYRGHFLNWYDTRDLRPLDPQYVSSVDSGNLAGHLISVANACGEWRSRSLTSRQQLDGVSDALEMARGLARRLGEEAGEPLSMLERIEAGLTELSPMLATTDLNDSDASITLVERAAALATLSHELAAESESDAISDLVFWVKAVGASLESLRRDADAALDDGRSGVEFRGHEMNRGAVFGVLGLERPPMRVKPGILRQQGRVDIEDSSWESIDELRR